MLFAKTQPSAGQGVVATFVLLVLLISAEEVNRRTQLVHQGNLSR